MPERCRIFFRQWKNHVYLSSTVRIGSEMHPLHPPSLDNTVHWDHRLLLSFNSTEVIARAAEKGDSAEGQQRKEILMKGSRERRFWWRATEKGDSGERQQRKEILMKGSWERRFWWGEQRKILLKGSRERRCWWSVSVINVAFAKQLSICSLNLQKTFLNYMYISTDWERQFHFT